MTAKHMCIYVSQNTRDSPSWKLSKLSSCEIMNVFEKNKGRVPFPRQSQDQRKGRKHLAVNRQQTSLRATKVLSSTKTNGYKKSKNMNANRIRVKSSRLKCVQAVLKFG